MDAANKLEIQYLTGDATDPFKDAADKRLIIHCCNNIHKWGRGFVLALSKKWKAPEIEYKGWTKNFRLGEIQVVPVEGNISVCNMIGQHGIYPQNGIAPVRYSAIQNCLKKVADYCKQTDSSVHAPRFGSDLAGGKWKKIEELINAELISENIPVFIYDLP